MLSNHLLSLAKVTEQSALACYPFIGKGEAMQADEVAVSAMRSAFNKLSMDVQIVIGEGERDQAPRLYTGEQLGDKNSSLKIDVAVDPLEGTTICAEGRPGALSVMAVSLRGQLFKAPDVYMNKIACGQAGKDLIDIKASPEKNISVVAEALGKKVEELTVGVLNRSRHKDLIQKIRNTKAGIQLVGDGDVALALGTAFESSPLDLLLGIGGAPEGVLSAGALKCLGGGFQGQLLYKNEEERERAKKVGVKDLDKVWNRDELARGDVYFFATGVTSGSLTKGIKKEGSYYITSSLILTPEAEQKLERRFNFNGNKFGS